MMWVIYRYNNYGRIEKKRALKCSNVEDLEELYKRYEYKFDYEPWKDRIVEGNPFPMCFSPPTSKYDLGSTPYKYTIDDDDIINEVPVGPMCRRVM